MLLFILCLTKKLILITIILLYIFTYCAGSTDHPPCSESVMFQVHGDSYDWRGTPNNKLQSTAVDDMSVDGELDVAAEIAEKLLKMYFNDKR